MLREFLNHPDVSEICELRSTFGIMAFHGGNLERTTDVIAREVADRTGSSIYAVVQKPPLRQHVPSTEFDPTQSGALAGFLEHVDTALSLHGYGREGRFWDLLVGGRNRALAGHLTSHLRGGLPEGFTVVDDLADIPSGLRGQHPDNPVNRPRLGGAQIELPPASRWNREEANWSDHEGTGRAPQVTLLIELLVAAILTWNT